MFAPKFALTNAIVRALMSIEADRQVVGRLPMDVAMLASLRESARLVATHYSTQIEGNRLTQAEVEEVLKGAQFPGRERDELEVRHYYKALELVESLAERTGSISEEEIRTIHGLAFHGRASPTPYRDGQNVIRDGRTGAIVYMPPEAGDVPELMGELVGWINKELAGGELPVPIIAGVIHYQFATIHPYYDGNGRTARLLTTLVLHRSGYGLKGIYSLDAYYARRLEDYYGALSIGPSHNYYFGRAEADITGFLAYFCLGMAEAFAAVKVQAIKAADRGAGRGGVASDISAVLREMGPRERRMLELFREQALATTREIADVLGLSPRTVVPLCREWVGAGFLEVEDPSRKARKYRLGAKYGPLVR